jgi:hypothetical protein
MPIKPIKKTAGKLVILIALAAPFLVLPDTSSTRTGEECCINCDIIFGNCIQGGGSFASCCTVYNECVFNQCDGLCPICTPPLPR